MPLRRIQGNRAQSVGYFRAAGFTVAELLVCIGILGLLVALLIPAVQSGREAARRLRCQDNLRQIGISLHAFESARQAFPTAGDMILDGSGGQWPRSQAPHLHLLPYLGEGSVYERVDLRLMAERTATIVAGVNDANEAIKRTSLPVFLCPSDGAAFLGRRNNYRANIGATAFPRNADVEREPPLPGAGAFFPVNRAIPPQGFSRGLSNTVGFTEKLGGGGDPKRFVPNRDFFLISAVANPLTLYTSPNCEALYVEACASLTDSTPPHESTAGEFWFYAGQPDTWYNQVLTPNHQIPDCGESFGMFSTGITTARSLHTGGVNCLMMGGAVRFVANVVDRQIWQAVGLRNGKVPATLE